jgi:hypothetical protein
MTLAAPGAALAFHHRDLPARLCSAEAAGDPSNSNGGANAKLAAHNPHGLPLPPLGQPGNSPLIGGTPGNGQGQGDLNCANAPQP